MKDALGIYGAPGASSNALLALQDEPRSIAPAGTSASDAVEKLVERLADYQQRPVAESTRKTYLASWAHFEDWCESHGRVALPADAETVAIYLDEHKALLKVATLQKRVVAISQVHQAHKLESPTAQGTLIRNVMTQIRRRHGIPQDQKTALLTEDLLAIISSLPRRDKGSRVGELTAQACRDRLILLLGFAGGFRRAELAALNTEDIRVSREGLEITVRRSKTDQQGRGMRKSVPKGTRGEMYCPVAALAAWRELSRIEAGPLFVRIDRHGNIRTGERLTDQSVAIVVKRWTEAIGLDAGQYAGHSLRAGLATSAALGGATETAIMGATGHKTPEMVRRYIRSANQWKNNPATIAGL